jgi:hypothetical protein
VPQPGPLRALYFPYSYCLAPTFIKQSLLLFDQLVFTYPIERGIREAIGYHNVKTGLTGHIEWDSLKDDYSFLEGTGAALELNPLPPIRQYDGLMAQAMLCDLQDPGFMELCSQLGAKDYWGILRGKIPAESLLADALDFQGTRFWRYPRRISSERGERHAFGDLHDFSSPFIMSLAHDYIPVSCGYSVNINLALLLAQTEGLVLLSDDPIALRLLNLKYERAKTVSQVAPSGPIISARSPSFLQKYNIVGLNVVNALLPDAALEKISFKALIDFRSQESAPLERLRQLLNGLVVRVESEPWSEDFERDIVRLIESEIIPEAQEIRDNIRSAYSKMFGGLVKRSVSTVTPTLAMSFLAGLSAGQILTMSCAAVSGALTVALPEIVDLWQEQKSQKLNGLSFLLRLEEEARKS